MIPDSFVSHPPMVALFILCTDYLSFKFNKGTETGTLINDNLTHLLFADTCNSILCSFTGTF